ncbi:hypothetical protein BDF19DRAFT_440551 [Syncephalis fuscata]|nr:hypothetical protein BDF19DRAFT_440551 [Syncephalis fuscata]
MQFLTTLIMITAVAASAIEVSAGSVSFDQTSMICLVNRFRGERKLPPFAIHDGLNKAAQDHSAFQARNNRMGYSFAGEPDLMERYSIGGGEWDSVRENTAGGQTSMEEVMDDWIQSPTHFQSLVSNATHFGSGMAVSNEGTTYWTQYFGSNDKLLKHFPKC